MITRRALLAALAARRVSDWVLTQRTQEIAWIDEGGPLRRTEQRTRTTLLVHHDLPQGRGSARLELGALEADAGGAVERALALASAAVGPAWRSPASAAPARVQLLDPALDPATVTTPLLELGAAALTRLRRPTGVTTEVALELLREQVEVEAHGGFKARWAASTASARALVTTSTHGLELMRGARRLDDLALADALSDAAADLAALAAASAPTPGRCAVILRADALLHGGGLGVWRVFADQASAEIERQGLTRYRPASAITAGADQLDEPLSITSDGALAFGLASAPLGDDAGAVRRFALIERGMATGLGLSTREAARRGREPNGGVRNLVVAPGTWRDEPPAVRTLDVRRLHALTIEPDTGEATLEIALALEREGTAARPVTGGTLRIDLVDALARAHRSEAPLRRGAYVGPAALVLADVDVLA